jgi:nucleotide-binding universal stress UspA family protein
MRHCRILFATDFSAGSELVREHAVAFARDRLGIILVTHVRSVPSADDGEGMLYEGIAASNADELTRRVEELARSIIERDGVQAEVRLLEGDPATGLLRLAEAESVDLIAMGTHGRSGLRRALMGSVTEQVLRRAPCPVLFVKLPDPAWCRD